LDEEKKKLFDKETRQQNIKKLRIEVCIKNYFQTIFYVGNEKKRCCTLFYFLTYEQKCFQKNSDVVKTVKLENSRLFVRLSLFMKSVGVGGGGGGISWGFVPTKEKKGP
jgi:hypothetical protein